MPKNCVASSVNRSRAWLEALHECNLKVAIPRSAFFTPALTWGICVTTDEIVFADKLTMRRARVSTVLALFFVLSFITSIGAQPSRPGTFKLTAWLVWAASLLFFLAAGGGLLRGRTVRALMNDDVTAENRRSAMVGAFWATMLSAFLLYGLSVVVSFDAREAIRTLLTIGVAVAVLRFGMLERRSLSDG